MMNRRIVHACFAAGAAMIGAATPVPAMAQPWPWMDITQNLSFGSFVTRNNDAQHRIIVAPDGTFSYDPALVGLTDPQNGEYLITDLPGSSAIGVNVTNGTLSDGGGPTFLVSDFTFTGNTTDPTGEMTLLLGATLRTSGSGQNYNSGNYTGTIDISVDY